MSVLFKSKKGASAADWISVGDELPDDEIIVLVVLDDEYEPVWLGFHDSGKDGWYNPDQCRFGCNVTHWAELPEPPGQNRGQQ